LFIEIGSDERNWGNVEAAKAIARSLLNVRTDDAPNAIGIGGGHYAPRFSEVCLSNRISFGHMVPNYAIENATPGMIEATLVRAKTSSNASLAYVHRKSMSGPKAREIKEICERIGLRPVDSSDLQPR
jgi:D-aminoacyl-tRNA deacylase